MRRFRAATANFAVGSVAVLLVATTAGTSRAASGPTSVLTTTTTVAASAASVRYGQPVTFTATVSAENLGGLLVTPSGSIAFAADNGSTTVPLGTAAIGSHCLLTITPCTATITTTQLPAGDDVVTATYPGDLLTKASAGTTKVLVIPDGTCEASASLSTFVSVDGSSVTAYVPKGAWSGGMPGVDVVNVEGSSISDTQISTGTDVINSVATNPVTGETIATANNNHVYVLKGTGLDPSVSPNPLTDGGSGSIAFSGGSATTTGVSIDPADNTALLGVSVGGVPGFQVLDLATDTFEPPITSPSGSISEDPLYDPYRHVLLSPAENNNYEIADLSHSTSPEFFENPVAGVNGEFDSAAEDCSTGIIMAPAEFSSPSQVFLADINNPGSAPEAVFTPGSPGAWTAPSQIQTLTGSNLSAGASGSAVAQGTHTGVISGEFGGDSLTAIALPTTSGAGATPAISNWVTCETGSGFQMGADPHTITAYRSPNSGDAIALLVNSGATQMVRVDLTKMLDPASVPSAGNVCSDGTLPTSAESFIALP